MRNRVWKTVIAGMGLMLPLSACDDNPLDESIDEVAALTFDRAFMTILPNDSAIAVVTPTSAYGDPVTSADVEFEACSTGVPLTVTAVADTADATLSGEHEVVIRTGSQLGYGCVVATGGGETDTLRVLVVPDFFPVLEGTVAPGDTVTLIRAIGQPAFDDNTTATVNGDVAPVLQYSGNADTLRIVIPFHTEAGTADIVVSNVGPGNATIPASVEIAGAASSDPHEPNEWLLGGGPTEVAMAEIPFVFASVIGDPDLDDFIQFTLDEDAHIDFFLDWSGDSGDLDFILYRPNGASAACNAATAAHPEHTACDLAAGTYVARINNYDEAGSTTYYLRAFVD